MDFTLTTYRTLLSTLSNQGFSFSTFAEFQSNVSNSTIVLRHDVDALPNNSLKFARIQAESGIKGSYFFRIVPECFDEKIIREIYSLGHEIGYHYEDVTLVTGIRRHKLGEGRRKNDERHTEVEIVKMAIERFKENLAKLREIVPVNTICMHGSPLSKWDSRLLWNYYDYHDFGIIGEPYFDINFDEVLYLTDTGRRWDGDSFNVRDKATDKDKKGRGGEREKVGEANHTPRTSHPVPFPKFHSTFDIIKAAKEGKLPDRIMMTFHPQRWTNKPVPWVKELVWQNVKNVGKYFLIRMQE